MSLNRRPIYHRPSIASLNSVHSSIWDPSRGKLPSSRRKSVSESVKFFVRKHASKFLRSEIWSTLVTLALQDGPFFAVRVVAISVYHVRSFLTYFFYIQKFSYFGSSNISYCSSMFRKR